MSPTPGYVVGHFIESDGKTPVSGEVTFTPLAVTLIPDYLPPTTLVGSVTVPLDENGALGPVGLVPTRYRVSFRFVGAALPSVIVTVKAEHNATPLNLATVAPVTPAPLVPPASRPTPEHFIEYTRDLASRPATTIRYTDRGEYVTVPFDPADESLQIHRPDSRPPFMWESPE